MTNVPEPESTPDGPAYEGRLLPRPDDEIVDQGAGFDIATMVTRRRVLTLVGAGVGAAALAACSTDSSTSTATTTSASSSSAASTSVTSTAVAGEIPEETNGPYPADGTTDINVLEDSGIVRSDITTSLGSTTPVSGVPLTFTFALTDMANDDAPFENAALYLWQCNAQGEYSMYTQGVEDETFLRGIQVADANGELTFQTIIPGCYTGRWPHLHFEVYPDVESATDVANAIATSQVAIPEEILAGIFALDEYAGSAENLAQIGSISNDNIFGDDDAALQMPSMTGDVTSGYIGSIAVGVDTTTEPVVSGMGGGGGMPPGGGGGMPPGGGEPPSGNPPSGMQPPN